MFTIQYIYGSTRLFSTLEDAEKFASTRLDSEDKCIIAEVKKVLQAAPRVVETVELPISSIQEKPCEGCDESIK
jgi:hypothetical protein